METPRDGTPGDQVRLDHFASNVQCMVCKRWLSRGQALPLASLAESDRGLVQLEGIPGDIDMHVCTPCLETLKSRGGINSLLNAFAHLESHHQLVQAFGRAFIGVVLTANLFASTNLALLTTAAFFFILCDWSRLASLSWTLLTFPPFLAAVVFTPWALTIFFGTRPFSFARLIDNPLYYCPWRSFVVMDETFIESIFLAFLVLGLLYAFAVFSRDYLDDAGGVPDMPEDGGTNDSRREGND